MDYLEQLLKAMADKNRLRILKLLERRRMCVCELAFVLGIAQPSVSRHLKKLSAADLIDDEQDGLWKNYHLKTSNPYTRLMLNNLRIWLNDNPLILQDQLKAEQADRKYLCATNSS